MPTNAAKITNDSHIELIRTGQRVMQIEGAALMRFADALDDSGMDVDDDVTTEANGVTTEADNVTTEGDDVDTTTMGVDDDDDSSEASDESSDDSDDNDDQQRRSRRLEEFDMDQLLKEILHRKEFGKEVPKSISETYCT